MKHYNVSSRSDPKDRLIDYNAFARGLRKPLAGRRLEIIEDVWAAFGAKDCITTDEMKKCYHGPEETWERIEAFFGRFEGGVTKD